MTAPQASSRLEMLQARFQQKQLQEKEQKLLQLYDQQQQRAYQVVQKGSAGSNGSPNNNGHHHAVSHQTLVRTSSHATSTSQAVKTRQQTHEERRQTSVKGIDRSYPLEPLYSKAKKQQPALNGAPRSNDITVNRRSVTVMQTMRADANSNVKPLFSYHEEITHESSAPIAAPRRDIELEEEKRQDAEYEADFENHFADYVNGNHRDENEVRVETTLDEDTIERNRMMAKLHLMEYDKSMKHRVRNDLESEEFPEDLMVNVPDGLPKRNATKKLSQAEARLERFKNANAKRNSLAKNTANPTSTVIKSRSKPILPARTSTRSTKSPSPDPTVKRTSSVNLRNNNNNNNASSSPSKSPDRMVISRRASNDFKHQESKQPRKLSHPKLSKSTSNGKSTTKANELSNGGIFQNGHARREEELTTSMTTATTTTTTTTKKGDSFVVDFNEQSPKKQQATPTAAARSASSISSVSSINSTPSRASVLKGRMSARAKTISSVPSPKGTIASKSGANPCSDENLVACKTCGRRFAQDRINLHEQICTKSAQKKRKTFDAMMYRIRGTDLEPFVKKSVGKKSETKSKKPEVKSNWRRKHEDFINAIRSAKQVQAHLAAGGRLSDLPPPPVSDTSDYIQCPHCGRKFNQAAAERHIPKCEHMLHNKPSTRAPPKPRR